MNCDPLNEVNNKIESILNSLSINGSLNFNVKLLITRQSKLGKFRILCKLHKNKFGIRPIINNCAHPTSQICKFIDLLIKPRLMETLSYLKDSQHLLQEFSILKIETEFFLYSLALNHCTLKCTMPPVASRSVSKLYHTVPKNG